MIKLFNTLGRQLQDFKPQKDGEVSLYTCGPTVYDYAHLGNLRSFVFDDTLRRMFEASDMKVRHVMNITDVGHLSGDDSDGDEDKLEAGAKREGKSVGDVAEYYTDVFLKDARELNILPPNAYNGRPDHYARATDFIKEQVAIVQALIDKGFAYQTKQAIYFDVTRLYDYGKLSGQRLEDKAVGAREEVVTDEDKKHPQDFAVWFFTVGRFKDHEMRWNSPWGEGFPGWHLECSAIIHATLGEPIDIHTGGVDHIGTHHTNEIAQTEAAYGQPLAHYWLHNEFLLVDGERMAKSAGNFFTLKDLKDRGFNPLALRLLFLQSHYRSQSNFTWEALEGAQNLLNKFYAWSDLRFQELKSDKLSKNYVLAVEKVIASMQNDLNSPEALGWFSGMVNRADDFGADSEAIGRYVVKVDELFGLGLSNRDDITESQKTLIKERETARSQNDYTKADELPSDGEEIARVLKKEQFDVINFHEAWVPWLAWQITRNSKTAFVATFHANLLDTTAGKVWTSPIFTPLGRPFLEKMHLFTATSPVAAGMLINLANMDKPHDRYMIETMRYIACGVELSDFKPIKKRQPLNGPGTKTIAYVGRLEKRKGIDWLIKAFAELVKEMPEAYLEVGGSGLWTNKMKQYVEDQEIPNVRFHGFVSDEEKRRLIGNADLACFPSPYGEGFGIVLLEAMAMGTPLLAGNNLGYAQVMKGHGRIGLVDPEATKDFANRMAVMLTDQPARKSMIDWELNEVKQYDYPKIVKQYEDAYQEAIARSQRARQPKGKAAAEKKRKVLYRVFNRRHA